MDEIKSYILRHPVRVKYGLIAANIIIILVSVRMYINYTTIEDAIQDTINQSQQKTLELAFSENFLLNYEKSEYAKYFLQHENNILGNNEFIVKFEQMPQKTTQSEADAQETISTYDKKNYIKSSQESWNRFIAEKISKIR